MNKPFLRKAVQAKIKKLTVTEKKIKSTIIYQQIINSQLAAQSQIIGIYWSTPHEVETNPIIFYLLSKGKTVCLPRIDDDNKIEMRQINDKDFVFEHKFNIKQPTISAPLCPLTKIDLMIIPGLAFDQNKHRLGRGQGFYDQLLTKYGKPIIMLAFETQKVPSVPFDSWDIKPLHVYTEAKIY